MGRRPRRLEPAPAAGVGRRGGLARPRGEPAVRHGAARERGCRRSAYEAPPGSVAPGPVSSGAESKRRRCPRSRARTSWVTLLGRRCARRSRGACERASTWHPGTHTEVMMTRYTLPELPYDYAALEPHYSARLLELHHDKHHAAYVTGANATLEKLAQARDQGDFAAINQLQKSLAFHLSGHVLHSLLWRNMSPRGGGEPDG